jgi:hypothetical protein
MGIYMVERVVLPQVIPVWVVLFIPGPVKKECCFFAFPIVEF